MFRKLLFVTAVIVLGAGFVQAEEVSCDDYLSQYDCVYQESVETCSAYSGCDYGSEFAVATGDCSFSEFNAIADAFVTLYPNKTDSELHLLTMQQCKAMTTTGDTSACYDACDSKTTGDAKQACMTVCGYDDGFGASLSYMAGSCTDEANCINSCESADYLADYCSSICEESCEEPVGMKGGSLSKGYCGDGKKSEYEDCDDGNNENGDGCNYNCHIEEPDEDDQFDRDKEIDDLRELLETGNGNGIPVSEQLATTAPQDQPARDNEDPEELPKAGAFELDTLTSKILLAGGVLVMMGLFVAQRRE